jgi:hypothetical protein
MTNWQKLLMNYLLSRKDLTNTYPYAQQLTATLALSMLSLKHHHAETHTGAILKEDRVDSATLDTAKRTLTAPLQRNARSNLLVQLKLAVKTMIADLTFVIPLKVNVLLAPIMANAQVQIIIVSMELAPTKLPAQRKTNFPFALKLYTVLSQKVRPQEYVDLAMTKILFAVVKILLAMLSESAFNAMTITIAS